MSSFKSSSSKGLLDPDAMLDLEEQLDYEPDGVEFDYENDSQDHQEKEQVANANGLQGHDTESDSEQLPEPSGQDDQESSYLTSPERRSLSYQTDLEKVLSITSSYRDKMNYNDLHVDVEKGSCRSKFGRYSKVSESFHLDSSDEEEEFSDAENELVEEGIESAEKPYQSRRILGNENSFNRESNLDIYLASPHEDERDSYEYYASSENSQTYENMIYPKDIWKESSESDTTTVNTALASFVKSPKNDSSYNSVPNDNSINNNNRDSAPKKQAGFNFSIKVTGNERIFSLPTNKTTKKKHKPWISKVGDYIDSSDIIKLSSKDKVIGFLCESEKVSVKSRLGELSDDQSSQTSGSDAGLFSFKVPLKRPPSRQKGTSSKNLSVCVNLKSKQRKVANNNQDDKDDIISLMASSCYLSTTDELEEVRERRNSLEIKAGPLSLPRSSQGTDQAKIDRTAQWVTKAFDPSKAPVPAIYKGLCYNYFLRNHCTNKVCKLSHVLVNSYTQIKKLPSLSIDLIKKAYEFAKEHPFLYGKIYKHFAEVFAAKDMKSELIDMAQIIFEEGFHNINREEGLNNVLNALERTNLTTFEDTVEYLLLHIGLKRYPDLGNVLLEIICKKVDLTNQWPIIRRLFIAGEKMNYKLGTKFLIHLMKSPVNLKVCQEVYRHILIYKCINLVEISNAIIDPFLKICSDENAEGETTEIEANVDRNLRRARFNFESTVETNSEQIVTPDFSVPPPTIVFGRPQLPPKFDFLPPKEFGNYLSHQADFSSLSGQETPFSSEPNPFSLPTSTFNASPGTHNNENRRNSSSGSYHDVDLRYRPPQSMDRRHSQIRSEEEHSDRYSDSDSSVEQSSSYFHPALLNRGGKKRSASTGLTYNKEGLQYDPANDYAPPLKKRPAVMKAGVEHLHAIRISDRNNRLADQQNEFDKLKDTSTIFPRHQSHTQPKADRSKGISSVHVNYYIPPPINRLADQLTEFDMLEENSTTIPRPHQGDHSHSAVQTVNSLNRGEQVMSPTNVRKNVGRANIHVYEATVSSSSDAKLRDVKPPKVPQFGKLYFDPNYEFNVSLHNLYLQAIDNVDIDEEDVHRLNDCVKSSDGKTFLVLVEKYKGPKTVQNFISMTLAHLKGMNQMVARTYQRLLEMIEKENPSFYGNVFIRVILEVITMNLLFELCQRHMMEAANNFLNKFTDWDSLVTSRLFISSATNGVSIIGRYLFIGKLLNYTKPELTFELLTYQGLHLLQPYDLWPYYPPCPILEIANADLEFRNRVITKFLDSAYLVNIVVVIELYKTAFRKKIWKFEDIKRYIDPMVTDLINKGCTSFLKQINNEIDMFYKHMGRDTLRSFLIYMCKHVSDKDMFIIYEKCVERKMYQKLVTGDRMEYRIEIKTNMHNCEISLIIKYYFYKLADIRNVPSGSDSLKFDLKFPGESNLRTLPLNNRSLVETTAIITDLLKNLYSVKATSVLPNMIEVEKEELVNYLDMLWT